MFDVLRIRDYRLVASGQLLSTLGDWMLLVAAPYFVLRLTGSTLATGLSMAAETVPALAVGPIAGVLADRWDRRRTMLAADLLRAATVAAMILVRHPDQVWIIYAALVVEASFSQFFGPASQALLPALVGRGRELGAANSLSSLIGGTVRLIGGPLGGLLYALIGFHQVVAVDAGSYLASAALIAAVRHRAAAPGETRASGREAGVLRRFTAELREGLAHIRRAPGLPALFTAAGVFFLGNAVFTALLVPYTGKVLHAAATELGLLFSALGVGYLVGAPLSRFVAARLSVRTIVIGSLSALTLVFAAAFNADDADADLALFTLIGPPAVCLIVTVGTHIARHTPDRLLGRVNSAYYLTTSAAGLVGIVGGSFLGQHLGIDTTVDIGVLVLATSAILAARIPRGDGWTERVRAAPPG